MSGPVVAFPLYDRARDLGVLDGNSALIVAPTATGKSHIGREAVCRALGTAGSGTHAYLVPFRALASEVFDGFLEDLDGTDARVRIATGDYRDSIRPEEADLVVATYESFAGLLARSPFSVGTIVADELHLIDDEDRGPLVEGLLARLLASGRARAICGLSAVIDNPKQIAEWLEIPLLRGTDEDRAVPLEVQATYVENIDEALRALLTDGPSNEQALIFCSSRSGAEKAAEQLAEVVSASLPEATRARLQAVAQEIEEDEPTLADMSDLLPAGVAYHHAGLPKRVRQRLEAAYRDQDIRVIAATPTLAAGVNLPAGLAVVRDIFRHAYVRGSYRRVPIPSGEILNMLGRAARPHQVDRGAGITLVDRRFAEDPRIERLLEAVTSGRGGSVASRLSESFEGLMRFVLAVIGDHGEATREDVAMTFARTLAYWSQPEPLTFDRSFEEDLMEDIPSFRRALREKGKLRLAGYRLSSAGVEVEVLSGDKPNRYEITIDVTGTGCTCPAARQWRRYEVCKHQALAIHELLFGTDVDEEVRARTIYNCGHVFGATLDSATRLDQAFHILTQWRLLDRVPGGWRTTPIGEVASHTRFDLLLVHEIVERIAEADATSYRDVALWTVKDYFAEEKEHERWDRALEEWLDEKEARSIKLPTRYRGDFERGVESLGQLCQLYEKAALALGRERLAAHAREAAGAVRYGVSPELVPLMALNFPQLRRGRCRLLFQRGIRNLADLADTVPDRLADSRRMPRALVEQWIARAKGIHRAQAVASADHEERDEEFDELVARFRVDPAALT